MKKLSIVDAAEYFGISKEAIHNRIRRGSLESVIEDGQKMVILTQDTKVKRTRTAPRAKSKTSDDSNYYKLLEEQNRALQERVGVLENETRTLRDQKELMLVQEREKIEDIYKEKDEQFKNLLNTLSQQFMLNAPMEQKEETVEVEMIEDKKSQNSSISLKKYLKSKKLSKKKCIKIQNKFKKRVKNDERIITIGSKIYLNPSKYDYSDLV